MKAPSRTRLEGANPILAWIKPMMIVSGALTCTMIYAAIAPGPALESTFGERLEGPVAEVVVRGWGLLIALVGAMLIHGAFVPAARTPALVVAGVSKAAFVALVLAHGTRFLGHQAGAAVVSDSIMVLLFAACLVAERGRRGSNIAGDDSRRAAP